MLSTNCALAHLTNNLRIKQEYGLCEEEIIKLVRCISSYYWLYNNAWDCLTADQQWDLDVFIKSNLNSIYETVCADLTLSCAGLASGNIVANLTDASTYTYSFNISPLAGTSPYIYLWTPVGGSLIFTSGTTSSSSTITLVNTDTIGTISGTSIGCNIGDAQGCIVTRTYSIPCTPYLIPTVYTNQCTTGFNIDLNVIVDSASCGTSISWVNTQFQLPAGISVVMVGSIAQFTSTNPVGTYGIQVRVKTTSGFYSNWSTLTVQTETVC